MDALYGVGVEQMQAGSLGAAIATFTRVIELKPDFAEGWNKRATLYFLVGEYRKSLADCDQVIERNPHHFGVLSGYAQIYARLGAYDRALDYARRALALNPNLSGMRESIEVSSGSTPSGGGGQSDRAVETGSDRRHASHRLDARC